MINVAKNKSLNNNDDDGEADYGGGGRSGGGGPVFDEENAGDNEDVIYGDGELSLIIGKTLPTPRVPSKMKYQNCHLIINCGSYENVVASHVVVRDIQPSTISLGLRKAMRKRLIQDALFLSPLEASIMTKCGAMSHE